MEVNNVAGLPVFTLTIGETQFEIAYPLPSVFAYEDASGVKIISDPDKALPETPNSPDAIRKGMEQAVALFWAGVIWKRPQFTRAEAGAVMHFGNMRDIQRVCSQALAATFPAKGDAVEDPTQAPAVNARG